MQNNSPIITGCDHAGFQLKESTKKYLTELGYKYEDMGSFTNKSSDYPKTAFKVAAKVSEINGKGILLCGTGIGESIVSNKVKGVRAANCFNEYTAQMSREHNNSNILCLGARMLSEELARRIIKVWLETEFSSEARHKRRVKQISDIESKVMK